MMLTTLLFVALGGSLGALLRYAIVHLSLYYHLDPHWLSVACINILGSFAIGLGFVWIEGRWRRDPNSPLQQTSLKPHLQARGWWLQSDETIDPIDLFQANQNLKHTSAFALTGFLGGFTTFSTFSLDMLLLIQRAAWLELSVLLGVSVVGSLIAVLCGMEIGHRLIPQRSKADH